MMNMHYRANLPHFAGLGPGTAWNGRSGGRGRLFTTEPSQPSALTLIRRLTHLTAVEGKGNHAYASRPSTPHLLTAANTRHHSRLCLQNFEPPIRNRLHYHMELTPALFPHFCPQQLHPILLDNSP